MTLSIAIAGVAGRMGGALIRAASEARQELAIVGGTEHAGSAALGVDLGVVARIRPLGVAATDDVAAAAANADVWIDFTAPEASLAALDALTGARVRAAIVGTTGLTAVQEARIADAAKRIAIVRSGNFSVGVTLLASLVEQAAAKLGDGWDIEIVETHHHRKIDAPSGTALLLGEAAAKGRGKPLQDLRLAPREGITGKRPDGGIGFAVVRGGGVVGEHDVIFAAEREVVTPLAPGARPRSVRRRRADRGDLGRRQAAGALLDARRAGALV